MLWSPNSVKVARLELYKLSLTFSDHGPVRGTFLGASSEPQDAGRPTYAKYKVGYLTFHSLFIPFLRILTRKAIHQLLFQSRKQNGKYP